MNRRGHWQGNMAQRALSIVCQWHSTEDDGPRQEPAWFEAGVSLAEHALREAGSRILVYCHTGINVARPWRWRSCLPRAGIASRP